MEEHKKVLILTADAGFGHRSAANALAAAIEESYASELEFEIANPLDDKGTPFFLRDSQTDYDRWVRNVPELYKLGYSASDALVPTVLMEQALTAMLIDVIRDLLKKSQPDVIVTTYPLYQSAVTTLLTSRKYRVPFYTIVTDLSTVHRLWFHSKVDGCLVPNKLVADLALNYGIPPQKISITGIPVHPNVVRETRDKNTIRQSLGLTPDIPTILAVGSRRVERMLDSLNVINHFGAPLQLIVVAGKDETIYNGANQMEWHIPAKIYNFVDNMPELMHASDMILCKAGGLIVTESLACGLPMILVDVIPGQETGNAQYVVAYGAGEMTESSCDILELLCHWMLNDGAQFKRAAANAKAIGQPRSAYDAAAILYHAAMHKEEIIAHRVHRRRIHRVDSEISLNVTSQEKQTPATDEPTH